MQLGGIGSGHTSDMHQVTNCIHDHSGYKKQGGAAAFSAMSAQMFQRQEQQQDAQFSLSAWLQKTFRGGRQLLRNFWGSDSAEVVRESGDKTGQEQLMAQVGDSRDGQGSSAAELNGAIQANPYFAALDEARPAAHLTPFQKIRLKVRGVTGRLAGKLPGRSFRFQAKNSFQAKPEQRPREDMRKYSRYKKDSVEIDCILTDESYLLDSYDRKGGYSRLTTKK